MLRIALGILSRRSWQSLCVALMLLCSVANAQVPGRPSLSIVSAASYESQAVAPDSIATIFGNLLAEVPIVAESQPLPLRLGVTTVMVKDARNIEHAAGLFFVSPTQINFLVPPQAAPGTATVTVNRGLARIEGTITIAPIAPGLFAANTNGRGPALGFLLRITANGTQQIEPLVEFRQACQCFGARPISFGAAADGQRFLVLFGTGWRSRAAAGNLTARIGSVTVPITFAGAQGGFAGLDQLNLALPETVLGDSSLTGVGRLEVVLSATGFGSSNVVEIERAASSLAAGSLQITGFEPARALVGERLTIRGSGFPTGITVCGTANCPFFSVRIGKLEAPILSSTETAITVRVPYGAVSDKVSVQIFGNGVTSAATLPVRTSLSGFVEDSRRRPLAGVRVTLAGTTLSARTNAEGLFVLPDAPALPAAIVTIDGTALGLTHEFPLLRLTVPVLAERDNFIAHPLVLQQATGMTIKVAGAALGTVAESSAFALQPAALWPLLAEFDVLQQQPVGNLAFTLPSNALVVPNCDDPGQGVNCARPIEQLTLTAIENSRAPVPLPRGYFSSAIAQIMPLNANIISGGTLTLPNLDRLPANQPVKLFHLVQGPLGLIGAPPAFVGEWIEYAAVGCATGPSCPVARVSSDGQRIEIAERIITTTGIYFAALERPTTTLIGRLVRPAQTGGVIAGQPVLPVPHAIVAARGQVTVTDDNGGFVLRHVPVLARGEQTAVEISFIRFDANANARVERLVRDNVALNPNSVTDLATIEANPVNENRPPIIFAGSRFAVDEGKTTDYELLVTDADSGTDPRETLRVNLSGPPFATLIARGEGRYTLRLAPGFADAGAHRVTISAIDRAGATATQQLALTVNDINQPPRALAQTITTDEDTPKAIVLTGNDPDRDALRFTIVTPPSHGRLSGVAPDLVYTPQPNYFGADSFTFKVSDGQFESEPATVTIQINSVNDAPVLAVPGEQRVEAGRPLSFIIIADDADVSDSLRIATTNLPVGATLTSVAVTAARAAARFDWTPTSAQTGLFVISFQASDNGTPALTTTRTVAITVAAAGAADVGVWRATGGPTGGNDLSALLALDGLVLAGTNQFGIYRSTNNGQTWTRNEAAPAVPNFVRALAASSTSLFAASLLGGIYRSDDRGLTWQILNQGLPEPAVLLVRSPYLLAARGATVFAVFRNNQLLGPQAFVEVYRSTDNGATWARVESGLPRFGEVVALTFSGNQVFVAYQTQIFRSADSGASWQDITPSANERLSFTDLLGVGNELFAATQQSLLRSSNQGMTWTKLEKAPPGISQLATNGTNLFAVAPNGTQQSVYRSTDNGATWTRADAGLPPTGDFAPSDAFRLAANATHLFVNAFGRIYVSANQGERWEPATALTNLTVSSLATLRAGAPDAQLFAATDAGVFTTGAPWQDWRAANNGLLPSRPGGLGIGAIGNLLTLENLLFLQLRGDFFRTADGGRSWQPANTGLPLQTGFIQTAGAHRTALFASVLEFRGINPTNTVYRSLDRGATWQEARQGLPDAAVNCFAATGIEGDVILAGTAGSGVYLSADNGTTWRALNQGLPPDSSVFALASLPGGSRLLAATQNGLFVFSNASQSWARSETGLPPEAIVITLYTTGENVFAVTVPGPIPCPVGGILLPDVDGRLRCFGGIITGPRRPGERAAPAAPEQIGLNFNGLSGDLYVSNDQGMTWAPLGAGLPRGVTTTFGASGRTVFAGTAGSGVFTRQF
jgi:uncharacterized protein (TIGR03437 family)